MRVLVISRRYWPLIDDASLRLLHQLAAMKKQGVQLQVLTARWHLSWPTEAVCREVPLTRVGPSPLSQRGLSQYLKQLGQWVLTNHSKYDLIYCDNAIDEGSVLLHRQELREIPIVIRYDRGDLSVQNDAKVQPLASMEVCRRAAMILVARAASQQQLMSIGILPQRITRVIDGAAMVAPRQPQRRLDSFVSLSNICGDLAIPRDGKVILAPGPLRRSSGVDALIQAVGPLLDTDYRIRLWMIGDGADRSRLYDRIKQEGWHRQVIMPGVFDDLEELYQAADAVVLPGIGEGLSYYGPAAWGSSLPCLIADSPEARQCTPAAGQWGLFEPGNVPQLRNLLTQALTMSPRDPLLIQSKEAFLRECSLDQSVTSLLKAFEKSLQQIRSSN